MTIENEIINWSKNKDSFYFFLPDGPYGRPFDNQYVIKSIDNNAVGFNIVFSEGISLEFIGQSLITIENNKIKIYNFKKLIFRPEENFFKEYYSGEVVINGF
ncbi:hypothetical protein ACL2XP_20615 [Sodalis sp. RH21]|uniref:hypothetical protein n=1 Tax=unclassified Sodalis (in: enterobacteria) TaxID=2636512 RepID=UPI0039B65A64